jgi:hypothetical protein
MKQSHSINPIIFFESRPNYHPLLYPEVHRARLNTKLIIKDLPNLIPLQ